MSLGSGRSLLLNPAKEVESAILCWNDPARNCMVPTRKALFTFSVATITRGRRQDQGGTSSSYQFGVKENLTTIIVYRAASKASCADIKILNGSHTGNNSSSFRHQPEFVTTRNVKCVPVSSAARKLISPRLFR
jgi:hypothetical protein